MERVRQGIILELRLHSAGRISGFLLLGDGIREGGVIDKVTYHDRVLIRRQHNHLGKSVGHRHELLGLGQLIAAILPSSSSHSRASTPTRA